MKLTANQIRYLLTIKKFSETKHVIRSVDIANELHYSRASVHKMVKCLTERNLISKEYYQTIKLTPLGSKVAIDYRKKYDLAKEKLSSVIKTDEGYSLEVCNLIDLM